MRLASFIPPNQGSVCAGQVENGGVVAYPEGLGVRDLLLMAEIPAASGPRWSLDDIVLRAPISRPGSIYAVGLNYGAHADETGNARPVSPMIFTKAPSSVAPPCGPVAPPPAIGFLDYEGELAVVLGADGTPAGFAVANDLTSRDLQESERHWTRAKGARDCCPWGPWLTLADAVSNPEDLRLQSWVNNELRQDSRTSDLIFGIGTVIDYLRETNRLEAGDLLLTGTPSGVGAGLRPPRALRVGDVVRIEIESLGTIEHRIEAPSERSAITSPPDGQPPGID